MKNVHLLSDLHGLKLGDLTIEEVTQLFVVGEDDHGYYTSTAEELNKITIIVIYLNALYLIL